jgi:inner membrane protease subunit 2
MGAPNPEKKIQGSINTLSTNYGGQINVIDHSSYEFTKRRPGLLLFHTFIMNRLRSIFKPGRTKLVLQQTAIATTVFTTILGTTSLLFHFISSNVNYHPVRGSSMSPALSPHNSETGAHDSVFISRWTWGWPPRPFYENLKRGDVVALRKPSNPEEFAIKRVVGLPGDRIVRVRNQAEGNEKLASKLGLYAVPKEVVVPSGHVWVEGDNWRDTFDSNDYGAIPINLITGRAVSIVLPWSRFGPIPERDRKQGRRTRVIKGVPPDEGEEAWKEVYNYK